MHTVSVCMWMSFSPSNSRNHPKFRCLILQLYMCSSLQIQVERSQQTWPPILCPRRTSCMNDPWPWTIGQMIARSKIKALNYEGSKGISNESMSVRVWGGWRNHLDGQPKTFLPVALVVIGLLLNLEQSRTFTGSISSALLPGNWLSSCPALLQGLWRMPYHKQLTWHCPSCA